VREAIAGRITMLNHIKSEHNYADVAINKTIARSKISPLDQGIIVLEPITFMQP
jgi:hypothetical protein